MSAEQRLVVDGRLAADDVVAVSFLEFVRTELELPLPPMRHCNDFGRLWLERVLLYVVVVVVVWDVVEELLQQLVFVDNFVEHFPLLALPIGCDCFLRLLLRRPGYLDRMDYHWRMWIHVCCPVLNENKKRYLIKFIIFTLLIVPLDQCSHIFREQRNQFHVFLLWNFHRLPHNLNEL